MVDEQQKEQEFPQRKYGFYTFEDGAVEPAVTHVISKTLAKPELAFWRGSVGNSKASQISAEARSFGKSMHSIVAEHISGEKEPDLDTCATQIRDAWLLWIDWWDKYEELATSKVSDLLVEKVIRGEGYAGTCDLFDGETVYDWKFGGGIYDSYKIQMGAYASALDANRGMIVRISKDEKNMEILKMDKEELEEAYGIFRHLLAVFNWREEVPN